MSRRRVRAGGALAAVAMAAAAAAVAGVARAAEYRDVDYTGNGSRLQFLDLYVPENATRSANDDDVVRTFLFVHDYVDLGRSIVDKGHACAVINYRLSLERDPSAVMHPDHTEDGAAAVAWLYANAAAYGLDRTRIVIGGHSAGGHMTGLHALQTALLDAEDPAVHGALRGVIGIEGIYDLPLLVADYPEYRDDFVALAFGANESAWPAASPQTYTTPRATNIPYLVLHSPQDELVNVPQSSNYAAHLATFVTDVTLDTSLAGCHFCVLRTPRFFTLVDEFMRRVIN